MRTRILLLLLRSNADDGPLFGLRKAVPAPDVALPTGKSTVQENLTHPELVKFGRRYRIYLTKEAIKETLLVWGLRKGISNAPPAPSAMSFPV